jgi:dipeptide/tripeptide permease
MTAIWLGAVLVVCGIVYLAMTTIYRGRMSDPQSPATDVTTLEPARRGLRFFGLKASWPGLFLIVIGAIIFSFGL